MKLAIDVKMTPGKTKFDKNDLLLCDGQGFYVTTYEALFYDLECKINNAIKNYNNLFEADRKELEILKKEFNDYKKSVSEQLLEMSQLIKKLYNGDDK